MTFTVTSKSWFGGKTSGEALDLGFQLGFSGSTTPKFSSVIMNGRSICGGGEIKTTTASVSTQPATSSGRYYSYDNSM